MAQITDIDSLPRRCLQAYDYALQVYIEEILTCGLVQAGITRFFKDLERAANGGPYYMDWDAAERVMRFVEHMVHIKGPDANTRLTLAPWQKFIYLNVFGWKHLDTGFRRFRKVYNEIPRGNGKSTMVAPVGLYMLSADNESGAEVYSAAVTRDQARIVFNTARSMCSKVQPFMKRAGISILQNAIAQDKSSSSFLPLSADARTLDGLNVHLAILDELAQHKTREVHDVIETGTGKRKQPLMWMITTAGPDQGGIGFEIHDYGKHILEGTIADDSFFTLIYTIDVGDDWTQPYAWKKANPNWGRSVQADTVTQLAQRAIQVPSFQNAFKMKHLNIWSNAAVGWMDSMKWSQQAMTMEASDFAGEECMIALDLASKVDIAAAVKIFRRQNNDDLPKNRHPYKYFIIPKLYLPEAAVVENRNTNYEGWALSGHLTVTPGEVIDFSYIEEDLKADCGSFIVKEIPFDPWQATQLAQRMAADGLPMLEFPAVVQNFSEPMKEFESLTRQGLLFHDNNPVFNWMISNLVVKEDHKGNIFPRKERAENKIDGPVAAIMSLARWLYYIKPPGSVYEDDSEELVV